MPFPWPRMRVLVVTVVGTALMLSAALASQRTPDELSLTDRMVVATRIYATVQQYFAHWEGISRSDFETAYRAYLDQAVRAGTRQDFDLATLRLIATLRNGHTHFFDEGQDGRPLKFGLLEIQGRWVVMNSQDSRLRKGDVVESIEGVPIEDFVRDRVQYVGASNARLARSHVFSSASLIPVRVTVGLDGGGVVVVDRAVDDAATAARPVRSAEGRWLVEGRVAYLRIPSFNDAAYERAALEFVRQHESAPNMIVDLRGNGGGSTPWQLIAVLMNRPWRSWQEVTPQHTALFEAQGLPATQLLRQSRTISPQRGPYSGRVFLLVDRFCGSACEDVVMPFKDNGRGMILGETTQGSSGQPYRTDLGHGMSLMVGAVRYSFPDGAPFEGIGIAPDVVVEPTLADVKAGRDAVLERARALATVPAPN